MANKENETEKMAGRTGESQDSEQLAQMYEDSLKEIQEGEVIKGKVLKIDEEVVTVDVGYKSEGQIPVTEFFDESGQLTIKVGDTVNVFLERMDDEEGQVVLSKEKADNIVVWDTISDVFNKGGIIEGKIISKTKGGMSVDIGVKAFLPGSQIDLRPVRNLDRLIGQTYRFKVLKFNKRRGNIVISRRTLLEEEREKQKQETLKILQEGQEVDGVVKNITNYGAFVDLGGFDGLLHITDMSWGRLTHPSERLQVGDKVKVKVLRFDREKGKVALGVKQLNEDPWTRVPAKYPPGTRAQGKVVNLADYGAFVELEEGVEGLVHVSEMSWTKKIRHPSKVVSLGEVVEAVVLELDVPNRRISLGMKQAESNPWDLVAAKYPKGMRITGKVKNVTDFGVFVGVEEGIDGLVHVSDLSWSKKTKNPLELFKKGQVVEAIVLNIDRENERFSLGIKQLEKDPWFDVEQRYRLGMTVSGPVTNVTDFGVFLELEDGVEGLIHVSELTRERGKKPQDIVKAGDMLTARVLSVDSREKKISLSVKAFEEAVELPKEQGSVTTSVGQAVKEKLRAKEEESKEE